MQGLHKVCKLQASELIRCSAFIVDVIILNQTRRTALCFSRKALSVPISAHQVAVEYSIASNVAEALYGAAISTLSTARYLKAQVDFTAMLKAEKRRIAEQRATSLSVRAPLPHNRVIDAGNLLHYALRRAQSALYLTCTNAMDVDGQFSTTIAYSL